MKHRFRYLLGLFLAILWIPGVGYGSSAPLGLEEVLREVEKKNPEIRAAEQRWASSKALVLSAYTPPSPLIGIDYWRIPQGGSLSDSSMKMTGIRQKLPFPVVLLVRGGIAKHIALAAELEILAIRETVLTKAESTYYQIWALQEIEKLHKQHQLLWGSMITSLEGSALTQGGKASHILRAQAQEASARMHRLNTHDEYQSTRAALSLLMGASDQFFDFDLVSPPDWEESTEPSFFEKEALVFNPALKVVEHHVIHRKLVAKEKFWAFFPEFSVAYRRMEESMGITNNFMIMGTVPINFWKPLAEKKAADWKAKEMVSVSEAAKLSLLESLHENVSSLSQSQRSVQTYRNVIVPALRAARDTVFTRFEAGRASFVELVDADEKLINAQLKSLQALSRYGMAQANVERILGRKSRTNKEGGPHVH